MGWALMSISGNGYRLSAGGVILSLVLACVVQKAAAQGATQVLTPLGYRDSANVHRVSEGYELISMPDTHVRMQNPKTGDYIDFPKPVVTNEQRVPFTDNGWVTYAYWHNGTGSPVEYFVADWNVPPPPSTYDGQTLFLFNSIEPDSETAILQPVLQYGSSAAGGGEYWAVASWYVVGNQAYFTSLSYVTPGQFLGGQITLIGKRRSRYSYTCDFYGIPGTTLTVRRIPQLTWCSETLEVYSVTQCTDFPNTAYTHMYGINIFLNNGYPPSMNWSVANVQTSCNAQTGVAYGGAVNAEVNIYY
jgi:hypothetical protein